MMDPLSAFMQRSNNSNQHFPAPIQENTSSQNSRFSFKDLFQQVKNSTNPSAILRMAAFGNPNIQKVLDLVDQNGGDAKGLFYSLCKEKNVDPESILSQLR